MRIAFPLILHLLLLLLVGTAQASPALFHEITATVSPNEHRLSAVDRISGLSAGPLDLELALSLDVLDISSAGSAITFERSGKILRLDLSDPPPSYVEIAYEGELYRTQGLPSALTVPSEKDSPLHIAAEEVFLHGDGGWYPSPGGTVPEAFKLRLSLKGGLKATSPANLEGRISSGNVEQSAWSMPASVRGLFVVAGPFVAYEREINGLRYAVYSRNADKDNGSLLIEASAKFLNYYSGLLGPYPHAAWSIVESSFSGYHVPGMLLMDSRLISQATRLIQPGFLDHHIVHAWLGHHVVPQYTKGNWSEPLVTYLASHYYREMREDARESRNLRIQTIERFSTLVRPDTEQALRDYAVSRETFDSEVAYGKGAMFFHLLRRRLGEYAFLGGVRNLVADHGGHVVSWTEVEQVFQSVSADDLGTMFQQWLRRKGGPRLGLEETRFRRQDGVYVVSGTITQKGAPYTLDLPVRIDTPHGSVTQILAVHDAETPFEIVASGTPERVLIDPDYHVFRILESRDRHPNLARLLEEPSHSYVQGPDARSTPVDSLIRALREKKGGWIINEDEVSDALGLGSLFIAGRPYLLGIRGIGKPEVEFYPNGFVFRGTEYSGPGQAILYSFENPFLPGGIVTVFAGNSSDALAYATYLPYYGSDTFVIFDYGTPVARGYLPFLPPSTSFRFAP